MAVVLAVAEAEYSDADEFELAVACAASLGLRAVRDARDVAIVTGSEIPRVVRGRLRAITHLPAGSPRPMLDAFSGVDRLENTMPVAEVCRLTAESGDRTLDRFRRRRLASATRPPATGRPHLPRRHRRDRGHLRRARPSAHADARWTDRPDGRHPRRPVGAAAAGGRPRERAGCRHPPSSGSTTVPLVVPRVLAGAAFTACIVILAAIAAWPIYRSWRSAAAGRRHRRDRRGHRRRRLAASLAGLAGGGRPRGRLPRRRRAARGSVAPGRRARPPAWSRRAGERHGAGVEGPRDGRSARRVVPQPAGSGAVVFLVGTCVDARALVARRRRRVYAAVPIAIGMVSFGLFFGRTTVSATVSLGPIARVRPRRDRAGPRDPAREPPVAGRGGRTTSASARSSGPRHPAASRVSRRPSAADRRRTALGAGMIAVALVVVGGARPRSRPAARERDVLRYGGRSRHRPGRGGQPALGVPRPVRRRARRRRALHGRARRVTCPERVRLATLDSYDGEVYRSGGSDSQEAGRFVRVPAALEPGAGTPVEAEITIEGLGGIWMPTAGRLASVDVRAAPGRRRSPTGFYYSAAAAAGVADGGRRTQPGDCVRRPRCRARAGGPRGDRARPAASAAGVTAPESLRNVGRSTTRRAPAAPRSPASSRCCANAGTSATASRRASTTARVDAGAARLHLPAERVRALARTRSTRCSRACSSARPTRGPRHRRTTTSPAVGDDEQFAVAVALIAAGARLPGPGRRWAPASSSAEPGSADLRRRRLPRRRISRRGPRCSPPPATGCRSMSRRSTRSRRAST